MRWLHIIVKRMQFILPSPLRWKNWKVELLSIPNWWLYLFVIIEKRKKNWEITINLVDLTSDTSVINFHHTHRELLNGRKMWLHLTTFYHKIICTYLHTLGKNIFLSYIIWFPLRNLWNYLLSEIFFLL